MLELHHIKGRISDSAFNACPLCKECHGKVGHTQEEHSFFFRRNFQFLFLNNYPPIQNDFDFLNTNPELVVGDFSEWLSTLKR